MTPRTSHRAIMNWIGYETKQVSLKIFSKDH